MYDCICVRWNKCRMLSVTQRDSTRSLERPACFAPGVCVCVFLYATVLATEVSRCHDETTLCVCVCVLLFTVANCNSEALTINLIRESNHLLSMMAGPVPKSPSLSFYLSLSWFPSISFSRLFSTSLSFSFLFLFIYSWLVLQFCVFIATNLRWTVLTKNPNTNRNELEK